MEFPVVVVDDNQADIDIISFCYKQSNQVFPFLAFNDGLHFLQYLKQVEKKEKPCPILVLIDMNLPGIAGLEIVQRVKQNSYFQNLPYFVLISSSDSEKDKAEVLKLNGPEFLTKKLDIEEYKNFFKKFNFQLILKELQKL